MDLYRSVVYDNFGLSTQINKGEVVHDYHSEETH